MSRDNLKALDEAGSGIVSATFEIVGLPPLRVDAVRGSGSGAATLLPQLCHDVVQKPALRSDIPLAASTQLSSVLARSSVIKKSPLPTAIFPKGGTLNL